MPPRAHGTTEGQESSATSPIRARSSGRRSARLRRVCEGDRRCPRPDARGGPSSYHPFSPAPRRTIRGFKAYPASAGRESMLITRVRLLVAFLVVTILASCSAAPTATPSQPAAASASASAGPTKGGVLRIGYGAEVDNLNAFTSQFLTDIELTMVEGLIVSNDKNEYIRVLPKQVPTVANGLVKTRTDGKLELTWPLQQGVMWHDQAHEFTADDVCFTWKYIVSPGSEVYNRNSYLPISDCRVQDKYTAVMVWDTPSAIYNGLFEAVLPKYMLEGKDIVKYDGYNRSPAGTGPFTIVDGVLEGTVQIADTVAPTTSPFYNPNVKKYPYDPTAAKKLLDDAGWKAGADGIREKGGEKLSLTALLSSADAIGKLYWQVIQQNMKAAGVDIKIDTKDAATRSQVWRSGQWEIQISRWVLPADPSVTGLYSCKGSNNMTGFCDQALDDALIASDQELDLAKRKALLAKAQELLAENAFSLPIYYNVNPIVISKKLGNFKASGTNLGSFWNVYEWYLNK